jgi:hypothetical protein
MWAARVGIDATRHRREASLRARLVFQCDNLGTDAALGAAKSNKLCRSFFMIREA